MQITQELEEAFQQKIKYPKDCSALAKDVASITNRNISSSTLRRLFGLLDSKSKISAYNLETLAFYIDEKKRLNDQLIKSNLSLKKDQNQEDYNQLKSKYNGSNRNLLEAIIESNIHPHKTLKLLHIAILDAIENEDIDFFLAVFQQDKLIISDTKFFRFLGFHLQEHINFSEKLLPILAQNHNARKYLFELYVDFGNFKTYKNWLKIYYQSEPLYINKLWALSLIIFGNRLSNIEEDHWNDFFELVSLCGDELEVAHPYLKGRVYGIGLLSKKKTFFENKITQELNENRIEKKLDNSFYPFFATILCQYILILKARKNIINSAYEIMKSFNKNKAWSQESALDFYTLLIETMINNSELGLNEIKIFHSGHTNEDIHLKLFALQFVSDEKLQKEVRKYRKQLIDASGFVYFDDRVV